MKGDVFAAACAMLLAPACGLGDVRRPEFVLPEVVYAAPDIECNVYFDSVLDSVRPDLYAFDAVSKVGGCESRRWTWTPKKADAGRRERLVLQAWTDAGLAAAATVTVQVASGVADKSARVTLALLGDSLTSSRYQDRLRDDVVAAGWTNYTPVGSHSGGSSEIGYVKGAAAHDGYGGFTPNCFLTRYLFDESEIDSINDDAEREQLLRFGQKIKVKGNETWRKGLLKSPLVRLDKDGKRVDVQAWLDRVNGGQPPDYIVIFLGVNGTCGVPQDRLDAGYCEDEQVKPMLKLIALLRERAPHAEIAVGLTSLGSEADSFARNYGCAISPVQAKKNVFRLNREWMKMVRELRAAGDGRIFVVPAGSAIDQVNGAIRENVPAFAGSPVRVSRAANAYHPTKEGGAQFGDAFAAWLLNRLAERKGRTD